MFIGCLFLVILGTIILISCSSGEHPEIRTVYPTVIYTDHDCFRFADSLHRFGRLNVIYRRKSSSFVFGQDLDYLKCLEITLSEGKFLILDFNEIVPPKVIRAMANMSTAINVWLSFHVASGPNCVVNPEFYNQTIEPYTSTILGFCEDERGPQIVYNEENLKSIQAKFLQLQKYGDVYAQINGQMIIDTEDTLINWNVIKSRSKGLFIRKDKLGLNRRAVLKKLNLEEHEIVWDDAGAKFILKLNYSAICFAIFLRILNLNKLY